MERNGLPRRCAAAITCPWFCLVLDTSILQVVIQDEYEYEFKSRPFPPSGGPHCPLQVHAHAWQRCDVLVTGGDTRRCVPPKPDFARTSSLKLIRALDLASLEARNKNQETPLNLACADGKADLAHFLIDRGSDIDSRDKQRQLQSITRSVTMGTC